MVVDGLDREAVITAVRAAAPEMIVHEMTALAGMRGFRNPDKLFAVTNEPRYASWQEGFRAWVSG